MNLEIRCLDCGNKEFFLYRNNEYTCTNCRAIFYFYFGYTNVAKLLELRKKLDNILREVDDGVPLVS